MSEIKRLRKMADKIYAKMENMQRLTDSELKGKPSCFQLNPGTWTQYLPRILYRWREYYQLSEIS